jgi:hypothetical protein
MNKIENTFCNLTRAVEIAFVGKVYISLMFNVEYKHADKDYDFIKSYYGEKFFRGEEYAHINVEICRPETIYKEILCSNHCLPSAVYFSGDLLKKQQSFEKNAPLLILNNAIESFLKNYERKISPSFITVKRVLELSKMIAHLDDEKKVEIHHIAEAMQYNSLDFSDNYYRPSTKDYLFGNVLIGKGMTIENIKNAISYFNDLKNSYEARTGI